MKQFIKNGLLPLKWIPIHWFTILAKSAIEVRLRNLAPKDALVFLMSLDNHIYTLSGRSAVAYGGGRHIKHRLTGYMDAFVELAQNCPGPYLDVGCFHADFSGTLAKVVEDKVIGIEMEPHRAAEARRRYPLPNLEIICGDATKLDCDTQCKTIILSNVLEHIEDRIDFLRRLIAHHEPEKLLIRIPNFERDWRVPLKRELGVEYRLDITHEIEHRPEELRYELSAAGLDIETFDIRWGEFWVVASVKHSSQHDRSILKTHCYRSTD